MTHFYHSDQNIPISRGMQMCSLARRCSTLPPPVLAGLDCARLIKRAIRSQSSRFLQRKTLTRAEIDYHLSLLHTRNKEEQVSWPCTSPRKKSKGSRDFRVGDSHRPSRSLAAVSTLAALLPTLARILPSR